MLKIWTLKNSIITFSRLGSIFEFGVALPLALHIGGSHPSVIRFKKNVKLFFHYFKCVLISLQMETLKEINLRF